MIWLIPKETSHLDCIEIPPRLYATDPAKLNDLSIAYLYNGEYDSRNIGLTRWFSINETATLIGSRY